MGRVFVTSDPHFLHRNQAARRGFATVEEHDETIIANVNSVVTKQDDILWIAGDVGWGEPADFLPLVDRLNGRKRLVFGNHDRAWGGHPDGWRYQAEFRPHFEFMDSVATVRINGRRVLISHFPRIGDHTPVDRCQPYRPAITDTWLLHGHTHLKTIMSEPRQIHIGLDAWDMKPVPIWAVEKLILAAEVVNGGEEGLTT